ncbi:MAG: PQQ-binding-like beta-propeller repeat protein [Planctomycetota bacterium]
MLAGENANSTFAQKLVEISEIKAGLCVHLGVTDGKLTAEFGKAGKFLVHGLATDQENTDKARQYIQDQKLYGQVSVECGDFSRLPYADSLVNLVVVDDLLGLLKKGLSLKETLRVVCPEGVALLGCSGGEVTLKAILAQTGIEKPETIAQAGAKTWAVIRKTRPPEMDEWTQYMHGADRGGVSHDSAAGVPASLRWVAGPEYPKATWPQKKGEFALLTAGGRCFYLSSSSFANLKASRKAAEFYVIARDAFNGLFLWEHRWEDQAIMTTVTTEYGKSLFILEPLPLVAAGKRVYAGGILPHKLVTLDAVSGKALNTIDLGCPILEITHHGEKLLVRTEKQVCQIDAKGENILWRYDAQAGELVVSESGVFFLVGQKTPYDLVRLNLANGQEQWRISAADWHKSPAPTPQSEKKQKRDIILRMHLGGVLVIEEWGSGRYHAISANDGKHLWETPPRKTFNQRTPPFSVGGLVWLPAVSAKTDEIWGWEGRSPLTGEVQKQLNAPALNERCGTMTATDRYIVYPGVTEFLDFKTGQCHKFHVLRGPCNVQIVPGNGLWYTFPHACRCYATVIRGFNAFSPDQIQWPEGEAANPPDRLVKGPAYGLTHTLPPSTQDDWPTLSHDNARSACAPMRVEFAAPLKPLWEIKLSQPPDGAIQEDIFLNQAFGDPISSPVISNGCVYVALPNTHQVLSLEAKTGQRRWSFTAGGMVDSPPTIADGYCIFGCRNGWLYCLDAADGRLAWRFRLPPLERRIVAYGQLESPWQASGSVLAENGLVYCSAGRSPHSDGGCLLCAVDIRTGKLIWEKRRTDFWGVNTPVLISDGRLVVGGGKGGFNLKTGDKEDAQTLRLKGGLFSGLLGGRWRCTPIEAYCFQYYWQYGDTKGSLLTFSDKRVFGYREIADRGKGKTMSPELPPCELFAQEIVQPGKLQPAWSRAVPEPAQVEALVVAGDTLIAAGPTNKVTRAESRFWVSLAKDGQQMSEYRLDAPPVFDGMAVACGRLYVSTQDGKLMCFGK